MNVMFRIRRIVLLRSSLKQSREQSVIFCRSTSHNFKKIPNRSIFCPKSHRAILGFALAPSDRRGIKSAISLCELGLMKSIAFHDSPMLSSTNRFFDCDHNGDHNPGLRLRTSSLMYLIDNTTSMANSKRRDSWKLPRKSNTLLKCSRKFTHSPDRKHK
jgi:hypothetical protein